MACFTKPCAARKDLVFLFIIFSVCYFAITSACCIIFQCPKTWFLSQIWTLHFFWVADFSLFNCGWDWAFACHLPDLPFCRSHITLLKLMEYFKAIVLQSTKSNLSFNLHYNCINRLSPLLLRIFQGSLHQQCLKILMPASNSFLWIPDIKADVSLLCIFPPSLFFSWKITMCYRFASEPPKLFFLFQFAWL